MVKGIFSVHYKSFELPDEYRVVFYQSVFEMALMQFLYYAQSEEVLDSNGIPEDVAQELSDLRDEYLGGIEPPSIFGAAIFFKKHADNKLLNGFREAAGDCVATTRDLDKEQYESLLKTHAQCIKRVLVSAEPDSAINSYCTVEIPLAFLFRTEQDCNGYPKQWPADEVIFSIIKLLSDKLYNSMLDFRDTVVSLAGTFDFDSVSLFAMIQSLMVTEIVRSLSLDVHQPFNTILAELLERLLKKEVTCQ